MPLYIDYHQLEGDLTIEDVREAHRADLANQAKYGVHYRQFWVNQAKGMVFCLIEGPNPEACQECHLASHGNTPCNIQEVESGLFNLLMGNGLPIDEHHMTLTPAGNADSACRTILVSDTKAKAHLSNGKEPNHSPASLQLKNIVVDSVNRYYGRLIDPAGDELLVGVFDSSISALHCARSIQEQLRSPALAAHENTTIRMALATGQPLTKNKGFFELAIQQAKRLCMIAHPGLIVLSGALEDWSDREINSTTPSSSSSSSATKVLTKPEVEFIENLFDLTEKNLSTEDFNVNSLSQLMGISRPQLYRKVSLLTGRSPSEFIREVRMRKAYQLVKSNEQNISEIALEVGYANPSYFSKIFQESFGSTPSELHHRLN